MYIYISIYTSSVYVETQSRKWHRMKILYWFILSYIIFKELGLELISINTKHKFSGTTINQPSYNIQLI